MTRMVLPQRSQPFSTMCRLKIRRRRVQAFDLTQLRRTAQLVLAVALLATCATAGAADLAILRNGNSIRHERRQIVGAITRLYLSDSSSGYIEIPTDQIERFERDTAPPPPAPKPNSIASAGSRPVPAPTQAASVALNRQDLNDVVNGAGERHQIDPDFINSVIRAESGFQRTPFPERAHGTHAAHAEQLRKWVCQSIRSQCQCRSWHKIPP